jgi:aromatic ring-opening dioxygenase LigB subunit
MISPVAKCRAAMEKMAANVAAAEPDIIVVITPHGIYLDDQVTVSFGPEAHGELDAITVNAEIDHDFAAAWAYEAANRAIPMAPVSLHAGKPFPLDWGVTIPLTLLTAHTGPLPIVVACPGRDMTREQLVGLGETLVAAAELERKRVALVVSADQGHGHAKDGPYGFSAESAEYDAAMVEAVAKDCLEKLLGWDDRWIEAGLPDSYWQTLSLIGVQRKLPLRGRLLAYEVDHYFGLLCAEYR